MENEKKIKGEFELTDKAEFRYGDFVIEQFIGKDGEVVRKIALSGLWAFSEGLINAFEEIGVAVKPIKEVKEDE